MEDSWDEARNRWSAWSEEGKGSKKTAVWEGEKRQKPFNFCSLISSILLRPPSQMLTLHYYGVQAEQKKLELLERIGRHFFSKNKELMPWKVELKRPLIVCLRLISKHYRYYFLTLFSGPNCSPHHQLQKRFTEKGCQSLPIYQTSTILPPLRNREWRFAKKEGQARTCHPL